MGWIDEIIVGIMDFYGTNNPVEILREMGISINKVDENYSLLSGKNCTYIAELNQIFIKTGLPYKHEMFYLRHELGHILLHLDVNNMMLPNTAKMEREANYFAFKLASITLDEVELYQMTMEQIACSQVLPLKPLKQLVNL